VQVHLTRFIDDAQGDQTDRELRWPDGVAWSSGASQPVIQRGLDDADPARQREACHHGDSRFDALTDTSVAGHHPPLHVWVLGVYGRGRNGSHEPMGPAWALKGRDGQQRTAPLREGSGQKHRR
jgi:hypothetical protein